MPTLRVLEGKVVYDPNKRLKDYPHLHNHFSSSYDAVHPETVIPSHMTSHAEKVERVLRDHESIEYKNSYSHLLNYLNRSLNARH